MNLRQRLAMHARLRNLINYLQSFASLNLSEKC